MPQFYNGYTGQTVNVPAGSSIPNGPGAWQQVGIGGSGTVQGGHRVSYPTYDPPKPTASPSMFPVSTTSTYPNSTSATSTYVRNYPSSYTPRKPMSKWTRRLVGYPLCLILIYLISRALIPAPRYLANPAVVHAGTASPAALVFHKHHGRHWGRKH